MVFGPISVCGYVSSNRKPFNHLEAQYVNFFLISRVRVKFRVAFIKDAFTLVDIKTKENQFEGCVY